MEFDHNRLKELREDADMTQDHLAELLSVSRKQVARWEHGASEMGIYKLKKLCEIYNVSADYILGLPKGMRHPR